MVFLDASDIQTTQPSQKLSHRRLGPFPIHSQVGNGTYCLCLPLLMSQLHPVFNVVKLSLAPLDLIPGCWTTPLPCLEIVDSKEEWIVEEILDSRMVNKKLHYLVKWEGFGVEHNSWEPWNNVHAPELVAYFYQRHPGTALLGDIPLCPMFFPINTPSHLTILCHFCTFLLIIANSR